MFSGLAPQHSHPLPIISHHTCTPTTYLSIGTGREIEHSLGGCRRLWRCSKCKRLIRLQKNRENNHRTHKNDYQTVHQTTITTTSTSSLNLIHRSPPAHFSLSLSKNPPSHLLRRRCISLSTKVKVWCHARIEIKRRLVVLHLCLLLWRCCTSPKHKRSVLKRKIRIVSTCKMPQLTTIHPMHYHLHYY